jgi:signal transduction histidine kinase
MDGAVRRVLRAYPLYFLIWTAVGLFYFSQGLTQRLLRDDPNPWWHYLLSWLVASYLWAILTPALLWLGRRFPVERANWPRRVPLHLLLSVAFSVFHLALESAASHGLGIFPAVMGTLRGAFAFLLLRGLHGGILTYWAVQGVQWGVAYYRRFQERSREALALELHASELQSQLMRARLSAMKMQLQPHFLFNTLNAIMVLVRKQEAKQAEAMLARLSDLLRCVLEDAEAQEVSLRRELEYLQLYLSIEQVRFGDRLRVEVSADPEALDAAVPQFGLQPIVENAIRHGVGGSPSAGQIEVRAARVGDRLELSVTDDGPGFPESESIRSNGGSGAAGSSEPAGIGLANTRARLEQLYGKEAHLRIENGGRGGAVVILSLPFHPAPTAPIQSEPET